MKSLLLLPLLLVIACGTVRQAEVHPCPVLPPAPVPEPSLFQVIGEARMALRSAYDLMSRDPEAQERVRVVDYILDANERFVINKDPRFWTLAACSAGIVADALPDMAIFAALEDTARLKRAHEMFVAMGGSCDQLPAPDKLHGGSDEEELDLDLGPSLGGPPTSL